MTGSYWLEMPDTIRECKGRTKAQTGYFAESVGVVSEAAMRHSIIDSKPQACQRKPEAPTFRSESGFTIRKERVIVHASWQHSHYKERGRLHQSSHVTIPTTLSQAAYE
jgi:hypothetical protein